MLAEWQSHLALSNYLSVLSLVLCSFLLLSFLVLPSAQSHRHYLSIGLLIPVLLISLSFAIPVSTKPDFCYDAITPRDMHSSMSCAWTGSFVTLGGLGCVIWVFLRSLWLFVRIVYDVAPGRKFMFGSIAAGTLLPVVFLVAVLSSTGFSYRMGQTCLPNHESAITTFWVWLVLFAGLGFILQAMTTSYCVWVYAKTLKLARAAPANTRGYSGGQTKQANLRTWANIKKLFILQWRNILVAVFVLIGSLVFFIVFWTQDRKLGNVFNDPENLKPVRTWIICQTLSGGDKKECRKYVSDFTVNQMAVVTSLILASVSPSTQTYSGSRTNTYNSWSASKSSSSSSASPCSTPGSPSSGPSSQKHPSTVLPPQNSHPSTTPRNSPSPARAPIKTLSKMSKHSPSQIPPRTEVAAASLRTSTHRHHLTTQWQISQARDRVRHYR